MKALVHVGCPAVILDSSAPRGSRPERRLTADQLGRIDQPTLLFWGDDDPFGSPEVGERAVAAMPAAPKPRYAARSQGTAY